VARVDPGSPGAQAGLQRGDVITDIHHAPLKNESDLTLIVNQHKPGDKITLTVVRGNQTFSPSLTLGQLPSSSGG
jgi:S1-C subfamily serine protease